MRVFQSISWLVLLVALTGGCQNPLDGVELRTKDPIMTGIVEIRLYDPASNPLPKTSRVLLVGPDAGKIVTTLNTTRYKVNADGVLLLAVSPSVVPSVQQPVRFTIVVEAEGYLTIVQPVVMTSQSRLTRTLRWIAPAHPPRTLAAGRIGGQAGADGAITGPLALLTPSPTQSTDRASALLEPGTRLSDRDGKPVTGDLSLTALYTNAREVPTSQVPGGGILPNVVGRNGTSVLGTFRVASMAGSMTLESYTSAYQLAYTASQPITWHMDLNPATINARTARAVQPGDSIPLYSYDAFANRWQQEKSGVVVRMGSGLEYQATVSRFVAYVAAWTESVCASGPVFAVSSKLASVDVNYLCKLIDVQTGAVAGSFWGNVNNGSRILIQNQPAGRQLRLQVFDETDAWGKGAKGGLIAESGVGVACSQTAVPVSLTALAVPPVMNLEFSFSCPAGTKLNESLLPVQILAQYSETGQENWRDLISATRTQRRVASYKLKAGRRYDFRASTDGGATWPLRETNYLVDKPTWVLKIRSESFCD